jgi:hypothetical protein
MLVTLRPLENGAESMRIREDGLKARGVTRANVFPMRVFFRQHLLDHIDVDGNFCFRRLPTSER